MIDFKNDKIIEKNKNILPNIYICGEQGTGKTLISQCFTSNFTEYKTIKISEPLYKICSLIRESNYHKISYVFEELGFDRPTSWYMRGEINKDIINDVLQNKKPRYALQKLGDIIRKYNGDALIERTLEISRLQPVIVEDVRLEKEGRLFKEEGFVGIRLIADEKIREKRLLARDGAYNKETKNHKTENEINMIPFDYQIENNIENIDYIFNKILLMVFKD